MINKKIGIGTFALVMLMTGAIDSIRNLPAIALFGTSLIFFFIFSAIVFLIPVALVSAELSSNKSTQGGIFNWIHQAFGDEVAFLAVWLQWISNVSWFPVILSFIAGTAAYLIDPALGKSKPFLISIILISFWSLTFLNLRGIHTSAKFASFCTVIGLIIPISLIILLSIIWIVMGHPLKIHFNYANLVPNFSSSNNWISLTAIMTAFLGIELTAVHMKDVNRAQQTFPKALFISTILILSTMILGSLAIAIVLPPNEINLVNGVMQAFTNFFAAYHLNSAIPIVTLCILIGSLGGVNSWIISLARGLSQTAQHGFMPKFLQKENKHGISSNILILQAIIVTVFCLAFLFMPSVNATYWFLTALSTQLYILMYIIMFIAGICLRYKFKDQRGSFQIPGGKLGIWFVSILGLMGCVITLIVGFIPPNEISMGSLVHYEIIFCIGMFIMLIPPLFFCRYKNKNKNNNLFTNTLPIIKEYA
jgi:amino acid transporter